MAAPPPRAQPTLQLPRLEPGQGCIVRGLARPGGREGAALVCCVRGRGWGCWGTTLSLNLSLALRLPVSEFTAPISLFVLPSRCLSLSLGLLHLSLCLFPISPSVSQASVSCCLWEGGPPTPAPVPAPPPTWDQGGGAELKGRGVRKGRKMREERER